MGRIEFSYVEVFKTREMLLELNQNFKKQVTELVQVEECLCTTWQGPSQKAFDREFKKDIFQMNAFYALINAYAVLLTVVGENYRLAEEMYQNSLEKIDRLKGLSINDFVAGTKEKLESAMEGFQDVLNQYGTYAKEKWDNIVEAGKSLTDIENLKDEAILAVFSVLENNHGIVRTINHSSENHYEHNKAAWKDYLDHHNVTYLTDIDGNPVLDANGNVQITQGGVYIEHQFADLSDMQFGNDYGKIVDGILFDDRPLTARENSCEVIATYNALVSLSDTGIPDESFPDLLYHFEQDGMALSGNFGTRPDAICSYFEGKEGYAAEMFKGASIEAGGSAYTKLEQNYDTYILTAWNTEGNIMDGIHTVSITRDSDGYHIHNDGVTGVFSSLEEAVTYFNGTKDSNGNWQAGTGDQISIIGVKKE